LTRQNAWIIIQTMRSTSISLVIQQKIHPGVGWIEADTQQQFVTVENSVAAGPTGGTL
jgi:hypothetical protein